MKDEAEQNSLNDLIASGGLPEATPIGEKTREQLIADKDLLYQENRMLKAERDAAFVRGLERAKAIVGNKIGMPVVLIDALAAEIDKAKAGK